MKTKLFLIFTLSISFAQAQWTQKTSLPAAARMGSASFVIDSTGYIIGGRDANLNYLDDVWAYNDQTDTWTQKASITGGGKLVAAGFEINGFGYLCTGWNSGGQTSDLLKYDPVANLWSNSVSFPGGARYGASSFVINNKAYVGLGYTPLYNDLWEFNPAANVWTQKANFPLAGRSGFVNFAVNGFGYVGTGLDQASISNNYYGLKDFKKYDPALNAWSAVSDMPSGPRHSAFSFVIGDKAYVGGGVTGNLTGATTLSDFYMYDPVTDIWTSIAVQPSTPRQTGTAFAIGNCGYIFGGFNQNPTSVFYNDLWQYCVATGISNNTAPLSFNINYNASTQLLHLKYSINGSESLLISIYDITGKQIINRSLTPSNGIQLETDLQMGILNSGLYSFRLINRNKEILYTGKFSVM